MISDPATRDVFLNLLGPCESRVRAFITGALATPEDRADFFQDVVLILWRKFGHYDPSRPFLPWAMGIAVRRMKEEYRKSSRRPCLLEEDHLERLAHALESTVPDQSPSAEEAALAGCLADLPLRSAALIQRRYYDRTSIETLSHESGQSAASIYQALSRLRRVLAECIRERLHLYESEAGTLPGVSLPADHPALCPPP